MIQIDFLADHPELANTLAKWFRKQWANYYVARAFDEVEKELLEGTNRDQLPIRMVALDDGKLAGTIILRHLADPNEPDCSPGLGGLLVKSEYRRMGIGTLLVEAGTRLAADLGYTEAYATSGPASGILKRLGWQQMKLVVHGDEVLGMWMKKIEYSHED